MIPDRRTPRFIFIGWLAILLAGVVTGDYVVDSAFEWPEAGDTSKAMPEAEGPEDSGEHLLMPSQRAHHEADLASFHVASDMDITAPLHLAPSQGARTPNASLIEFTTHPPPCFLLPLRI
jgi:hypothetical protein